MLRDALQPVRRRVLMHLLVLGAFCPQKMPEHELMAWAVLMHLVVLGAF